MAGRANRAEKKRLVLLDAHAILHRAYHALPDFTSAKGEPTGALYGLSAMLLKLIADLKPDYLVACFDLPAPTYRHEAYEGYKAKRPKMEEALASQINRSRDVFKAFGIPLYEKAGFEADDLLGTIVERLKDRNLDSIIASGDMDALQLVRDSSRGESVSVYTLKKGINDTILYDEKGVKARFGFSPEKLTDYKGLRGDPSDNIIGVPGIGEKTATELILKFGTIENIYGVLKKGDRAFIDAGFKERIVALLREHEEGARFSKMLATIKRDVPVEFSLPEHSWREGVSLPAILDLFTELSFRTLGERAKAVLQTKEREALKNGEDAEVPVLENVAPRRLAETGIALWLLDSTVTAPSLQDILLFAKTDSFEKARAAILAELKRKNLERVYEGIELPLLPVILKMEERGIRVDVAYLKALSKEYRGELAKLEKKIYALAGREFNVNSPRQLAEVLFEKLKLTVKNHKKTGTGLKSTRESELEKMRELHPIIGDILSYRELQKLLSTYIDNIPDMAGEDGRLRARFLQTGTTTGRMSSQSPNLQNIPIRSELGNNIRKAFVAERGFKLVAFDYSQIELRVAAFLSKDKKLTAIFKRGGDVHASVASEVFGVPADEVDYEMRRRAKIINFGILYGMGVNALRANLGSTRAEAQEFYNAYFKTFSGLAAYLDRVRADAARLGYTETYFGRRRHLEGIQSSIPYIRAQAERMAINAPIQGTEADIIKIAMVRVDDYLKKNGLEKNAHLLLQVHDELVYEIRKEDVETVAPRLREIMEGVVSPKETGGIVCSVAIKVGENWGEMKKLASGL